MKTNYKTRLPLLVFIILQCFPFFINAQTTFQKVYPTSVNQSGRDVLPTNDGGYLIAGVNTTVLGDSNIYMIKTNSIGDTLWTKNYGGPQPEYPYCLIPTADGNFFVLGYTKSFGSGRYDTWLLKINPSGTIIWSKTYGTAADEKGHEIISTADGNYMITGFANNDAFLMKIDPAGNALWTKTYGGLQAETSNSVKQCLDLGYIFVGQTFSYGMGAGDIYVVKTNSLGDTTWTKTFGGIYGDEGMYVLANPDGTYMIDAEKSSNNTLAGLDVYLIKADANGNSIWTKTYGGLDKDVTHFMQPTTDGGYVIASTCRSFGWINPDLWLIKINAIGDTLWTRHFGSYYHDHAYAVRQTADGGYIIIGHQEDSNTITHVFFVKLNGLGQVLVEEFALNNNFSVYPNPTNGIVKIDWGTVLSNATVKISNALGKILFSETVEATNTSLSKTIDLKDKEAGIYFVSIQSEKSIITKKIILE